MLVKPLADSEEGHDNQEAHQKYETMQCFAVSQPNSFKEDGEGNYHFQFVLMHFQSSHKVTSKSWKLEEFLGLGFFLI